MAEGASKAGPRTGRCNDMRPLLVSMLILASCASTLTPEEIEYRNGIRAQIWEQCKKLGPTVSMHDHRRHKAHRPSEVHEDNVLNQCYRRVGEKY